ncbi:hypothetical protein MKW98_009331, partial [Papaver atlanticum]
CSCFLRRSSYHRFKSLVMQAMGSFNGPKIRANNLFGYALLFLLIASQVSVSVSARESTVELNGKLPKGSVKDLGQSSKATRVSRSKDAFS